MNEIEVRRSVLTDVHAKQRLIDLIAVPWEQETEVLWRDEIWKELFLRGAFDGIEKRTGRIRVNREHVYGNTVGKIVAFDPAHTDGLFTQVKIASTDRGDETLALAEEDMISPSVGFMVKSRQDMQIDRRTMTRRIHKAFLDHLAMVESPAYPGAEVLAVRESPPAEKGVVVATPVIDQLESDETLLWAASYLRNHSEKETQP